MAFYWLVDVLRGFNTGRVQPSSVKCYLARTPLFFPFVRTSLVFVPTFLFGCGTIVRSPREALWPLWTDVAILGASYTPVQRSPYLESTRKVPRVQLVPGTVVPLYLFL